MADWLWTVTAFSVGWLGMVGVGQGMIDILARLILAGRIVA